MRSKVFICVGIRRGILFFLEGVVCFCFIDIFSVKNNYDESCVFLMKGILDYDK